MTILKDYKYELPSYLIAKYPPVKRGFSRLFVYYTQTDQIVFSRYYLLYRFLPKNTLVVRNKTKVINARLKARAHFKEGKSKIVEILLVDIDDYNLYEFLKKHVNDRCIRLHAFVRLKQKAVAKLESISLGEWEIKIVNSSGKIREVIFCVKEDVSTNRKELIKKFILLLEKKGHVPIPPYFKREDEAIDRKRYQTQFASLAGSVAAPTASLNFTKGLERRLLQKGINLADVVLHVGLGTFAPVTEENVKEKKLHKEYIFIDKENLQKIIQYKMDDNPILAVGTTVVRTLETLGQNYDFSIDTIEREALDSFSTTTELFIYGDWSFKVVDMLLTNFHLPGSSLIMLVDSFLRYKKAKRTWRELYEIAIRNKFRFYSYGDSMLII